MKEVKEVLNRADFKNLFSLFIEVSRGGLFTKAFIKESFYREREREIKDSQRIRRSKKTVNSRSKRTYRLYCIYIFTFFFNNI